LLLLQICTDGALSAQQQTVHHISELVSCQFCIRRQNHEKHYNSAGRWWMFVLFVNTSDVEQTGLVAWKCAVSSLVSIEQPEHCFVEMAMVPWSGHGPATAKLRWSIVDTCPLTNFCDVEDHIHSWLKTTPTTALVIWVTGLLGTHVIGHFGDGSCKLLIILVLTNSQTKRKYIKN